MTSTPYAISRNIGSQSYNGYLNTPILGPLSTNQYPYSMEYHNYGTLKGLRPSPPQFTPYQEPVYSEMNTNARSQYKRATGFSVPYLALQKYIGKDSPSQAYIINSTAQQKPISTHTNYIEPIPQSMLVNIKKSQAIGKSVYKVGLPLNDPISTKNYYPSGTRTSLRRARSGGCVAPKKKGSIYNNSLRNSATCAWGSLPRINY